MSTNVKLMEIPFGPITTVITNTGDHIEVKMESGRYTIFQKSYPNSDKATLNQIQRIPSPYSIIENTSGTMTTFKYMFGGELLSEFGIDTNTKRISFVGSFNLSNNGKIINIPTPPSSNIPMGNNGNIPIGNGGRNPPMGGDHGKSSGGGPDISFNNLIKNLIEEGASSDVYGFSYVGQNQTFTVPTNAKEVIVECWGAGGGTQGYGNATFYNTGCGGGGGYTKAKVKSIGGQVINVLVGQGGQSSDNGATAISTFGGGGSQVVNDSNWGGASGGGRSAVQLMINGGYSDIVTAGGGGGGGGNTASGADVYLNIGSGGSGGGTTGGDAEVYDNLTVYGGLGGAQSSGGSNGTHVTGSTSNDYNASLGKGGGGFQYGAGGGGGYYGGGFGGIISYNGEVDSKTESFDRMTTRGLVVWFDTNDSKNVTVNSSGAVTKLKNLMNDSASAIPLSGSCYYSATALNNTKPGITIDDASMYLPMAVGTFDKGVTMIVVFSSEGNQQYNALISRTDTTSLSSAAPWDLYNSSRLIGYNNGAIANTNSSNTMAQVISPTVYNLQASPSVDFREWFDGADYYNSNVIGSAYYKDTGSYIYLGTRGDQVTSFNGVISEVLIYDRVLGTSELNAVNAYLASKWGITVASITTDVATEAEPSGGYWIFGGGGGGSSYVDPTHGTIIRMDQAKLNQVAAEEELPTTVKGSIGNGAKFSNNTKMGAEGQNGYVRITCVK